MTINIGIIGCGLIGKKRYRNVGNLGKVLAVSDKNIENAKNLIKKRKLKFLRTETTYKDKN